jgi:portal protein
LNLQKALEGRRAGADRAHRPLLLENGLTYAPTSTTPRDSQFAELREDVRSIANFLNMPASMLKDRTALESKGRLRRRAKRRTKWPTAQMLHLPCARGDVPRRWAAGDALRTVRASKCREDG